MTKPPRIPGLDGIRAVAILIVVVGHLAVRFKDKLSHFGLLYRVLGSGGIGVDLFFVLSGFLITRLLLQEHERYGKISLSHFYLRRAFRILPAFYIYLAAVALLKSIAGWKLPFAALIRAGLFLYDYSPGPNPWLVAHTWSLAVEEQFYIVWPILLGICLRRGGKRAAIFCSLTLIALATGFRIYDGIFDYNNFLGRDYMMLHTRIDTLMFGCLFALLAGAPRFEAMYLRLARIWWIFPAWFLFLGNLATRFGGLTFRLSTGLTLNGFAMAAFILYVSRTPTGWLGRVLNYRPVVFIGVLSYSIYIWQQLFTTPENTSWTGRLPGMLLCIAAVPVLSYFLIERPALRLRSRKLDEFRPAAPDRLPLAVE